MKYSEELAIIFLFVMLLVAIGLGIHELIVALSKFEHVLRVDIYKSWIG